MNRINDWIFLVTRASTRAPLVIIALIFITTVVFGYYMQFVERDQSIERMLPENEPIRVFYKKLQEHFDIKSKIIVGVYNPGGVFTPEVLAQIDRLGKDILELDEYFKKVQSLTTIENITAANGEIRVSVIADKVPQTAEEIAAFREAVKNNPMISGEMLAKDRTATILVIHPTFEPFETDKCIAGYEAIKKVLDNDGGPGTLYLAGLTPAMALNNKYMDRDNKVMLPVIFGVVIFLLWLSFHSLRGVWVPLSVVVAAVVWTFGALGILDVKINIISTSIPIVLVAMGIADGIHILHEYYHQIALGLDNLTAIQTTMRKMNSPVIMTSLTTAAGFLALSTSKIIPVREYGVAVAFGIMAAMVFSLTFIPASLAILGKPKKIRAAQFGQQGLLERMSKKVGQFSIQRGGTVIAIFLISLLITGFLSVFVKVRNNPIHYLKSESEVRRADDFLNAHFAGTGEFIVQIVGKDVDSIKDPLLLEKMQALETELSKVPEVGMTFSITDFLKRMNYVMNDQDPAYDRLPGTKEDLGEEWTAEKGRAKIAQFLLLYEMFGGQELAHFVDTRYQHALIQVHVKSNDSTDYRKVMDALNVAMPKIFTGSNYQIGTTGAGALNLKVVDYLVVGQILSLSVSFAVVFFFLLILFRSFWLSLIGSIPLLITVTTNFAVMVIFDIPLSMGTALIASIIIGVGVDYSIHFIHRYRAERLRTPDINTTVQNTMETSGRAILFNAISVGGGFAVLLFSSFLPVVYFGLLVPIVMAVNAFAALLVIPTFLNILERRRIKKVAA